MKKHTNDIGPGTKNVSVNMPIVMHRQIAKLAAQSGMTFSQYVRETLRQNAVTYLTIPENERPKDK